MGLQDIKNLLIPLSLLPSFLYRLRGFPYFSFFFFVYFFQGDMWIVVCTTTILFFEKNRARVYSSDRKGEKGVRAKQKYKGERERNRRNMCSSSRVYNICFRELFFFYIEEWRYKMNRNSSTFITFIRVRRDFGPIHRNSFRLELPIGGKNKRPNIL